MGDIALTRSSFAKVRVMVVGDFMLDKSIFGTATRVSAEAPQLVFLTDHITYTPGGAGNSAVNIAALGASVLTVGTLGNDESSERFLESISSLSTRLPGNIDISGLEFSNHNTTTTKTRLFDIKRSNMQAGPRIDEERPWLYPDDKKRILSTIDTTEKNYYNAVLLSDYSKGVVNPEVVLAIRDLGIPLIVDTRTADYLPHIYASAKLIKPNENEARAMLSQLTQSGYQSDTKLTIEEVGAELRTRFHTNILITRGKDGMILFENKKEPYYIRPIYRGEHIDVIGAGDTVAAVVTTAIGAGWSLRDSAYLANLAASIAVTKTGTAHVTIDDLIGQLG